MEFLIANTFTDSLAKLTGEEQKAVRNTAFEFQMNPVNTGMQLHRIDNAKDENFWSVRVTRDIRLIVHKTAASTLLCYVGHHDPAYEWAERRKIETHPTTGAAQIVEIRETVREIPVPKYVEVEQLVEPKPFLFSGLSDNELLAFGVPQDWLKDVREANEDSLMELVDHLPGEAAEALINLATGTKPAAAPVIPQGTDPFAHPDAQRRFRIMSNIEELERALDYPWEKWSIFLHPAQREIVEGDYEGPARVSGSAGTGKTIVALHRAVYLARKYPDSRILLSTFSDTLANALKIQLKRLISNEPRIAERLEVHSMRAIGRRLYKLNLGELNLTSHEVISELIEAASRKIEDHKFSLRYLLNEWDQVVDAWQLNNWDAYRDVKRLGRKTRLPEKQRAILWSIFENVHTALKSKGLITEAQMFDRLASHLAERKNSPFDFAVIDEAQDINPSQLKFSAALSSDLPNSLFFAGDLRQRIFQEAFSWKSVGVDVENRSYELQINYRTSHQIRKQADRLLPSELTDADGRSEDRTGTISLFNGPAPDIRILKRREEEIESVAAWLSERQDQGTKPHEIGVIVRSPAQLDRAESAVQQAGFAHKILDQKLEPTSGKVAVGTMHLAKGLEFKAVVVMGCDDDVIPLQARIESVTDESDLQEVYDTERHLLYVACTRARDQLLVTSTEPASEFLDDLKM